MAGMLSVLAAVMLMAVSVPSASADEEAAPEVDAQGRVFRHFHKLEAAGSGIAHPQGTLRAAGTHRRRLADRPR
ncbi:MAG: hypothetical protein FJZ92_12920 [Chloroflexi bacterium]|nr:hypothetical protein [Chloroflexota bacterium]